MKKNNIFRHELNESIQAQVALNCLKNRNNHKQLNETSEFDNRFEFRKDLRELASPTAKKAYMIIKKQYGDSMWRQLGMDDCDEQGLIDMLNMYAEDGLKPQQIVNKMMGVREDEETVFGGKAQEQEESTYNEKEAIAKQLMVNYNPDTDEFEDPEVWLLYAIQERIGKQFLGMPKKEVKVWKKVIDSAITEYEFEKQHPAHYEHPEDEDRLQSQLANAWDEGMEDDEDDYVPYENKFDETHHDIVDSILEEVYRYFQFETDVEGFNLTDYTEEQVGKAIEQILDKTGDFPSSVNNNVCYAWVRKHAEEIIKVLEKGSLENPYEGHPEFDFSEQEEMEVTDAKQALTQLAADLLHYDDGDLDEVYYAISDIIDSEGYCPVPDEYEMWIEEHVNEIEDLIM